MVEMQRDLLRQVRWFERRCASWTRALDRPEGCAVANLYQLMWPSAEDVDDATARPDSLASALENRVGSERSTRPKPFPRSFA